MKVGVFLDDYVPQDGGGFTFQTEVFESLLKLASETRHEFVIITNQPALISERIKNTSLEILRFRRPGPIEKIAAFLTRNWPNLRRAWRWSSSFERSSRRAGIEFIWFLGPRPRDIDIPYMTIVLDLQHRLQPWFPEVSRWGEWHIRERGFARFLGRAAAIIAGTRAGVEEITRFYRVPDERVHVLPHPTPSFALRASSSSSSAVLKRFHLPENFLLYPAQFWPHKNHLNLLLALKQLRDESDLNLPLVLVGSDFGNKSFIEQKIRELHLADQVHILGFVSRDELIALYQNALALTYVTFFGPENLPPLEAMALACPVIASNVAGAEEQFGDAAILVDPARPDDIAAAILKISQDEKLRQRLIKRGRKRASSWTVDDFVRRAFKILDDFDPIRRVWQD